MEVSFSLQIINFSKFNKTRELIKNYVLFTGDFGKD